MTTDTVTKRLLANLSGSAIGKLLVVARQLFLVPLFLHVWGVEVYGQYILLSAIPTMLNMSNLGMGTAAGISVSLAIAGGKREEAGRIYTTGLAISLMVGSVIILGGFALIKLFPGAFVPLSGIGHSRLILILLLVSLASDQANEVMNGVYIGCKKMSVAFQISNSVQAVRLAATFFTLLWRQSPLVIVTADTLINVLATLFFIVPTVRLCPYLYKNGFRFYKDLAGRLLVTGIGFQAAPLWQAILFQGSLWLAQITLGAVGVATWSTLRALCRSVNQFYEMLVATIYPEIQLAIGSGNYALARKLHGLAVCLSVALAGCALIPLSLCGPVVYRLWTNGVLTVPPVIWPLLGLSVLVSSLLTTSGVVHRAMGRPWLLNGGGIITALLSLLVMYLLAGHVGIVGFAIGGLVFESVMSALVLSFSLRWLGDTCPTMVRRARSDIRDSSAGWIQALTLDRSRP